MNYDKLFKNMTTLELVDAQEILEILVDYGYAVRSMLFYTGEELKARDSRPETE